MRLFDTTSFCLPHKDSRIKTYLQLQEYYKKYDIYYIFNTLIGIVLVEELNSSLNLDSEKDLLSSALLMDNLRSVPENQGMTQQCMSVLNGLTEEVRREISEDSTNLLEILVRTSEVLSEPPKNTIERRMYSIIKQNLRNKPQHSLSIPENKDFLMRSLLSNKGDIMSTNIDYCVDTYRNIVSRQAELLKAEFLIYKDAMATLNNEIRSLESEHYSLRKKVDKYKQLFNEKGERKTEEQQKLFSKKISPLDIEHYSSFITEVQIPKMKKAMNYQMDALKAINCRLMIISIATDAEYSMNMQLLENRKKDLRKKEREMRPIIKGLRFENNQTYTDIVKKIKEEYQKKLHSNEASTIEHSTDNDRIEYEPIKHSTDNPDHINIVNQLISETVEIYNFHLSFEQLHTDRQSTYAKPKYDLCTTSGDHLITLIMTTYVRFAEIEKELKELKKEMSTPPDTKVTSDSKLSGAAEGSLDSAPKNGNTPSEQRKSTVLGNASQVPVLSDVVSEHVIL